MARNEDDGSALNARIELLDRMATSARAENAMWATFLSLEAETPHEPVPVASASVAY